MLVTLDDVLILVVDQSKAISELTEQNEGYGHFRVRICLNLRTSSLMIVYLYVLKVILPRIPQ